MTEADPTYGVFRSTTAPPPFENLVKLHVEWRGNRLGDKFSLNLLLEAGDYDLKIPIKPRVAQRIADVLKKRSDPTEKFLSLVIRLRYCDVLYKESNVTISPGTKYRSVIIKGKIDTRTTDRTHSLEGSRLAGALVPRHSDFDSLAVSG
jgi:hypothetical protein